MPLVYQQDTERMAEVNEFSEKSDFVEFDECEGAIPDRPWRTAFLDCYLFLVGWHARATVRPCSFLQN